MRYAKLRRKIHLSLNKCWKYQLDCWPAYIFRNFAITKASPMEESENKLEPFDNRNSTSLLPLKA